MKILDCTLRDGGYYTNWDFSKEMVLSTVESCIDCEVDHIELGYKSPVIGGKLRKCNDGYLKSFLPKKKNFYCFMIDLKDFVVDGQLNHDLLKKTVNKKDFFDICRVAIKFSQLKMIKPVYDHLVKMGYQVIINIMAITDLSKKQVKECISSLKGLSLKAVYFADSYGNLLPSQIEEIVLSLKLLNVPLGFHSHDNMGLAFANTLSSINLGVTYIDSTITGMGRGVGNLKTEHMVYYLGRKSSKLLNTIEEYYEPIKKVKKWGFSIPYMESSLKRIHPLTSQHINSTDLTTSEKMDLLSKFEGKMSYNKIEVEKLLRNKNACIIIPARYKSSRFPGKPLALISEKEMIIHVCEKAEQAVGKKHVYVATEDKRIAETVERNGYNFILTSDSCLTGTDRVAEASEELDYDIYVNLQGDEPLVSPKDILRAISEKRKSFNTVINCATKITVHSESLSRSVPKVVFCEEDMLLYASRSPIPGSKGQACLGYKQVCIYCYNKKELKSFLSDKKTKNEKEEDIEILRFLDKGISVKILKLNSDSVAVDHPEDIAKVEDIINRGEK